MRFDFKVRNKRTKRILLWILCSVAAILTIGFAIVYFNRDEIKQTFINELNKHLLTEVGVKEIEIGLWSSFPLVSVSFNNISIAEAYADTSLHRDTLAALERLSLEFNLIDILKENYHIKKIEVQNGKAKLKILPSGDCNYLFWKTDTAESSSNFAFSIKSVSLKNIQVDYHNEPSRLFFSTNVLSAKAKGNFSADIQQLNLSSDMLVRRFAYDNLQMQSNIPLSADIDVENNRLISSATINPSSIKVGQMRFNTEGTFEYKDQNLIKCRIGGEEIKLAEALSLFKKGDEELFKGYKAKGTLNFAMQIDGALSQSALPLISARFDLTEASLSNRKSDISLTSLSLKGSYTNGKDRNSKTSALVIDNFSSTLSHGFVKGRFELRDFNRLSVNAALDAKCELAKIKELLKITEIETLQGKAEVSLRAEGELKKLKLGGRASVEDFALKTSQLKDFALSKTKLDLKFDNDKIIVEKLDGKLNNESLQVSGVYNMAGNLQAEGKLSGFKAQDIELSDIDAAFTFNKGVINCKRLSFGVFDGKVKSNDCRILLQDSCTLASGTAQLHNINLKKTFSQTKNLNQNLLTDKNIKGSLTANAKFSLYFDKDFNLILERSSLNTDYNLSKGELNQVEILKKLSHFVEEEALNNVRFEPIASSLQINDGCISLNPIKIKSNAVDFDFAGKQHLDGRIDYSIAIRLSELASRKKKAKLEKEQQEFGTFETSKDNRITLFVRIKGTLDNPIFSYDAKGNVQRAKEQLNRDKKEILRSLDKDFDLRIEERKQDKEQWKRQEAGEFIIEWDTPKQDSVQTPKDKSRDAEFIIEW